MLRLTWIAAALWVGCGGGDTETGAGTDRDGDGFDASQDCDDTDAAIHPGAEELCDGRDNDCDGTVDQDASDAQTLYLDADSDGFGDDARVVNSCEDLDGYAHQGGDCDDLDEYVSPIAVEVCDGLDDDCDGLVDDDDDDLDTDTWRTWYADADGDGAGDAEEPTGACVAPQGYVGNTDDCDDTDATLNPDTVWYGDADQDGYGSGGFTTTGCEQPSGYVDNADDCDDTDVAVNPGAVEVCDEGVDDDCNGLADDDDPGLTEQSTWYADEDGDGFGDDDTAVTTCAPEAGWVTIPGDCDDAHATAYPGAEEICFDLVDNNCDGSTDEDCSSSVSGADVIIQGRSPGDYFGYRMATGADIDGDGVDDLLVGAYGRDDAGANSGSAYLFKGPLSAGSWTTTDAALDITGGAASDYFGHSLAMVGDFNGDGGADLVVGAFGADLGGSGSGSVYLFGSTVASSLTASGADFIASGTGTNDYLGMYDAAESGDLNDDGVEDLVIGAHNDDDVALDAGSIYVVFGPLSATISSDDADVRLSGAAVDDAVGYRFAVVDRDGDGVDDLVAGVTGSDELVIVDGPLSAGDSFVPSDADATVSGASGDGLGSHIEVGDFDGDGEPDFIIGARYYSDMGYVDGGAVYVVPGTAVSTGTVAVSSAATVLITEHADLMYLGGHYQGLAVGDVDGDGCADLVAGSYMNSDLYFQNGAAFLFFGGVTGSFDVGAADDLFYGEADNEYMGYGVAMGDLDDDSLQDIVVGVRGYGANAGRLGVWWGSGY